MSETTDDNNVDTNEAEQSDEASINVDNNSYKLSELDEKTRSIVLFLRKLDGEIQETRYNLNKGMLARKQAVSDLKAELAKK